MKTSIGFAVIILLLLTAHPRTTIVRDDMNITFRSGTWHDKNWYNPVLTNEEDAIPDAETAMEIASALIRPLQKQGKFDNFIVQSVFYDIPDNLWIISFWEESNEEDEIVLGPCYSIAIKKSDAQVLRMWLSD